MDESEAGSVAMTGTLPHRERNGQPRDHLTLAAGRTKNEPWDLDSGIGTVMMADIPEDVSPRDARIDDEGKLYVVWDYDGHESRFEPGWLRAHCYSETARLARRHRPKLWDASFIDRLPSFDYQQIVDDDSARLEAFEHLRDYGFARMRGAPLTLRTLKSFADLFGHRITSDSLGPYSDIKTRRKKLFFTDVPAAIPKHTDQCYRHTPLGINFFHCLETGGVGGESVLADAFEIARVLRETEPKAFELLSTVPIQFYRYIEGVAAYYTEACIISVDYLGEVTGFRYSNRQTTAPLDLPAELVEAMHDAQRKLSVLMRHADFEIRFMLEPGDILAYDNQRVIHGRAVYDDSLGARHLRSVEVSREEFHNRLRLLMIKQNRPEARSLSLARGALA